MVTTNLSVLDLGIHIFNALPIYTCTTPFTLLASALRNRDMENVYNLLSYATRIGSAWRGTEVVILEILFLAARPQTHSYFLL